jgi:hypothetical protein
MATSVLLLLLLGFASGVNMAVVKAPATRWNGWSALNVGRTREANGPVDKLRALRRFAKHRAPEAILVFVNSYIVVLENEPFQLEAALMASGRRVLIAGKESSGCAITGYARDIRRLLRLAWKESLSRPPTNLTDQQLMRFLVSDGATVWTRESVGIDRPSEAEPTAYRTDLILDGVGALGLDDGGRIVFDNRTVPAIIRFHGRYAGTLFPMAKE